jgi:polar amino acid transport system substrate-binding protein/membrane-bound lytic murein transglycosylase F
VDSNEVAMNQVYFTNIRVALTRRRPQPELGVAAGEDNSLLNEINAYLDKVRRTAPCNA